MTNDYNKKLISIKYNYLNLPNSIRSVGEGEDNLIQYLCDAAGKKLRYQPERNRAIVKTTDYIGNFVYEDN